MALPSKIAFPARGSSSSRLAFGLALAALGALTFSGKAIIVKLAYRHGVDAVTLIMYRMLMALPFFVAMAWWAGRGKASLSGPDLLRVIFLGVIGYYLSSFLDFLGLQYISASLERLILYLNPTLVLVLGWMFHGRRITAWQVLGMAVSYAGLLIVFIHEIGLQGQEVVLGSVLVFASALSYAVYLVYSGEWVQRLGSLRLVGLATTVACLCCIAQFAFLRPLSAAVVAPEVLGLSLVNALVCTVAPVLMIMMAIERLGPGPVSQVGMIGPLSTIFMGVLILDEPLTPWVLAGTALVLAGIYVFTRSRVQALPE